MEYGPPIKSRFSVSSPVDENKQVPSACKEAIRYALSFFPELQAIPIHFKYKKAILPVKSGPTLKSYFKQSKDRSYQVTISEKTVWEFEPLLFQNLDFNAQVGLIAHELAHIIQFQQYDRRQLITKWGSYFIPENRERIEQDADKRVIEHGLGWELYAFANRKHKAAIENPVIQYQTQFHLSPEEVLHYIQTLNASEKANFKLDFKFNLN